MTTFPEDILAPSHPARLFWESPGGPAHSALLIYSRAVHGDSVAYAFYATWRMVIHDIDNAEKLDIAQRLWALYRAQDNF